MSDTDEMRPVIVTTAHGDIWYGRTDEEISESVTLYDARHVYYWSVDDGGLSTLTAEGPDESSKIDSEIDRCQIRDVVTVQDVSDEAADRFDSQGWGGRCG